MGDFEYQLQGKQTCSQEHLCQSSSLCDTESLCAQQEAYVSHTGQPRHLCRTDTTIWQKRTSVSRRDCGFLSPSVCFFNMITGTDHTHNMIYSNWPVRSSVQAIQTTACELLALTWVIITSGNNKQTCPFSTKWHLETFLVPFWTNFRQNPPVFNLTLGCYLCFISQAAFSISGLSHFHDKSVTNRFLAAFLLEFKGKVVGQRQLWQQKQQWMVGAKDHYLKRNHNSTKNKNSTRRKS